MFKTGDRVKIKSREEIANIERKKSITGPGWTPGVMGKYCGLKATVIHYYGSTRNWVYLDVDNKQWVWDDVWLDKINGVFVFDLSDEMFEI